MAYFSIINWPSFRSSRYGQLTQTGSLFDHQLAHFSLDKNMGWGLGGMSQLALHEHKLQEATLLSLDSLKLKIETQDRVGIAYSLETLAMIASEQAQARRAAALWGAAEQLRETLHSATDVTYRDELAIYIARARSQLDAATLATAWAEGRAMTMEQAIELALGENESNPHPKNIAFDRDDPAPL